MILRRHRIGWDGSWRPLGSTASKRPPCHPSAFN
ncbi:unnamed protein product [Ixodes pacificus]